ncbi:hypothetical protein C6497_11445 [Candidatus Poribacteria bacterium]|nr:MAG: hypothetical protein C6497_11445 [Candidatus Poribacteria bacterium]
MNSKNIIITLIIISFITIPNLTYAIRFQTAQFADNGYLQNDTIQKQAQYDAEKDAIQNTNSLLWFGTGLACCLTTSSCAIVGGMMGGIINPPQLFRTTRVISFYMTPH